MYKLSSRVGFSFVLIILLLTPFSPLADFIIEDAEATGVSRHNYTFSDGSTENIALFQGGAPDRTTKVSLPKGAEVLDVEITLSGASSTGWSQVTTDTYDEWMDGSTNRVDTRSEELTLGFADGDTVVGAHSIDEPEISGSTSWLDNGSFAIRQPHTSNSTESRFTEQVKMSRSNNAKS
jgi:hypothetical protein